MSKEGITTNGTKEKNPIGIPYYSPRLKPEAATMGTTSKNRINP